MTVLFAIAAAFVDFPLGAFAQRADIGFQLLAPHGQFGVQRRPLRLQFAVNAGLLALEIVFERGDFRLERSTHVRQFAFDFGAAGSRSAGASFAVSRAVAPKTWPGTLSRIEL